MQFVKAVITLIFYALLININAREILYSSIPSD